MPIGDRFVCVRDAEEIRFIERLSVEPDRQWQNRLAAGETTRNHDLRVSGHIAYERVAAAKLRRS